MFQNEQLLCDPIIVWDIKAVIRRRKWKDRQYNGQKKKDEQ
jgi:hypothetical protein